MDSIFKAVNHFLQNLNGNTQIAYRYDFLNKTTGLLVLLKSNSVPTDAVISTLHEEHGLEWVQHLKDRGCSPATIARRVAAFKNLLRFCALRYRLSLDAGKFGQMLKDAKLNPKPKSRRRVPMDKVDQMLDHCLSPIPRKLEGADRLREIRNRAFIVILADTGARVGEAVSLTRSDINLRAGTAVINGKGDKRGVLRFSKRALTMLNRLYTAPPTTQPGSLGSVPIFAAYTKKAMKTITAQKGRDIVQDVARASLGDYIQGEITPHSLRHYFVMVILKKTGGSLKKAKELARHESIVTTEKYTQMSDAELDQVYSEVFNG